MKLDYSMVGIFWDMGIIQLSLPGFWWLGHDWRDGTVDVVSRPVETAAFRNIRAQVDAARNREYRTVLSALEQEIHDMDMELMRTRPALASQASRAQEIALVRRDMGWRQVSAILDDVSMVMRDFDTMHELEEAQSEWAQLLRDVWKEVVDEELDIAA